MSTSTPVAQRLRNAAPVDSENLSLLLVLPGLFFFSAFMFYPMVYLVYLSFTNARPSNLFAGEEVWVGLANYTQVLSDPQFWNSIWTTWLFVGTSVVLKLALGITIALVVTSDWVRGKRFMRSLIIVPMGLPAIFTITVWRGIFSPAEFGLANQLLGTFGVESVAWFQERWLAFVSYNITEMWLAYPFIVIITVSALQDVPEALHDAAKVDGAGFLARFRHVTLPSIKRPVLFATILTAAASFQQFLIPYVFNDGGPARKNELVIVYGYREAFEFNQYGLGATIMLVAVVFIGVFMWLNVKKGRLAEGVAGDE
ncbi:carbohydrate ABC transporter permease [Salinirubrum litoreum]|uniref:Carbohydrate ABC transporter permease n=1 Tax=Salinirubrum litoreum TaxID=1126234 RepID=A0ABD5R5W9_9EURY|nr:sugar ABC transporter permease [Salinirubrum litoreum]